MRLNLPLSWVLVLLCAVAMAQANSPEEITPAEIKQIINEYSQCDSLDQITIDHLEYFDLLTDGHKQAVVVASTCMTGTAGPDIHSVYARDAAGKAHELPFHHIEGDPFFNDEKRNIPLFGNRNYGFRFENGLLVATWQDTSDRENPLVVWYKWDGAAFVVDHIKVEGPFPTSYDCGRTTAEIDRAICYSPKISALDVRLAQAYRAAMDHASFDQKQALRDEQRQWLAQREKQCAIYKWWVDCLSDLYSKRILELDHHSPTRR